MTAPIDLRRARDAVALLAAAERACAEADATPGQSGTEAAQLTRAYTEAAVEAGGVAPDLLAALERVVELWAWLRAAGEAENGSYLIVGDAPAEKLWVRDDDPAGQPVGDWWAAASDADGPQTFTALTAGRPHRRVIDVHDLGLALTPDDEDAQS